MFSSILILTSWIGENFQFLVEYVRQCVCEMKRKWLRRPFRISVWEELGGGARGAVLIAKRGYISGVET